MHILTFGGGVNSVALAIEMMKRSMPLDYIIFSDTLAEKPETYAYMAMFSEYLKGKGYPEIVQLPPYKPEGLYGECIALKFLIDCIDKNLVEMIFNPSYNEKTGCYEIIHSGFSFSYSKEFFNEVLSNTDMFREFLTD